MPRHTTSVKNQRTGEPTGIKPEDDGGMRLRIWWVDLGELVVLQSADRANHTLLNRFLARRVEWAHQDKKHDIKLQLAGK